MYITCIVEQFQFVLQLSIYYVETQLFFIPTFNIMMLHSIVGTFCDQEETILMTCHSGTASKGLVWFFLEIATFQVFICFVLVLYLIWTYSFFFMVLFVTLNL